MASVHYHEFVWDYVYGLLEPAEAENLRAHVANCTECRAALVGAEGQQQMLARAARAVQSVPEFTLPGQDAQIAFTAITPESPPATVPLAVRQTKRAGLRRHWPVWAAAAALLGAAIGLNHVYQSAYSYHEGQIAQAKKEVEAIDGQFAALQAKVSAERQDQPRLLQELQPPQLQVLGTAEVYPGTPANFHVTTRDQAGKPLSTALDTKVVDPANDKVLREQIDRIEGEKSIQVAVDRPARVVMEAKIGKAEARVEEFLKVAQPTYASHLALNKSIYRVGDVLFFRSLTLDRYSLKPPAKSLPLNFALLDAGGRAVTKLAGQTEAGGVSFGELAVTPELVGGNYTLKVSSADGNSLVLPQSRNLEIVGNETPQIEFDRNIYKPGDKIAFNFRGGSQASNNAYANKDVNITVNADGLPVPQAVSQAQTRLDKAGNLDNYQLQLPAQIKNTAEIVIGMRDGKKDNKLVQPIPVVASARTIDLFPEGGDLIAGVVNTVYYRVRLPQGDSGNAEGRVVFLGGKKVLYDSEQPRDLGSFTFTPDPKESYAVRITGPGGVSEIADPFQKLGIRSQGLVLHAPKSVLRDGDPLHVILRNQAPARRLLLQTTCRGQIVDQRYVDVQPGSQNVTLQPAPGAAGVLRVTGFDASADRLVPVAERLLYRVPGERLDVSCQLSNGPGPYAPGNNIALNVKATDEGKNAEPVWMLAAVVDEKYRTEKIEPSLAAHFYLAGDVGGEELESANLVLNDTPESRQALDLFLGTQGWRRFVPASTPALLALSDDRLKADAKAIAPPGTAFFSLQNTTPQMLQDSYQATLTKGTTELIDRANRERAALIDQKDTSRQVLAQAVRELAEFKGLPGEYVRLACGLLALGLLVAGGVFLVVGLVRLLGKKATSQTGSFGGAFACLFACLLLYVMVGRVPVGELSVDSRAELSASVWPEFTAADVKSATADAAKQAAPPATSPPLGYFVAQGRTPAQESERTLASVNRPSAAMVENLAKRSESMLARSRTRGVNQFQNKELNDQQRQLQQSTTTNEELQRRFARAAANSTQQARGPQAPSAKPTSEGAGGFGAGAKKAESANGGGQMKAGLDAANTNYSREYAHRSRRRGALDLQDTLLWHPTLFAANGEAQLSFDASQNLGTYRILVYANSASGRLGFYEGHLEVRPPSQK